MSLPRPLLLSVAPFIAAVWMYSPVHAQTTGTLRVRVIDEASRAPISKVAVSLRRLTSSAPEPVLTDSAGYIERAISGGDYEVLVNHFGYRLMADTVLVQPDEVTSVVFELRIAPVPVDSVLARTDQRNSYLGGFWERRQRNIGYYFTREDIEKARPLRTADLFRRVPGAKVLRGPNGLGQLVTFERIRRIDGTACPAMLFVDGRPYVPTAAGLDDFPPDDIEAIEAYSGSARLPAQFNAVGRQRGVEPMCGVIVIWTRGSR